MTFLVSLPTQSLLDRLEAECRRYEEQHGLRSDRLRSALRLGAIAETAEVAEWWVAYRTLLALRRELRDGSCRSLSAS